MLDELPRMTTEDLGEDTLAAAQRLLGCVLVRRIGDLTMAGRIVEAEAYLPDDPASHSFRGRTARNASMFDAPGRAYVYLIYGVHYCLNVVTGPSGFGAAVLIRALEPLIGRQEIERNRGRADHLTDGPAKVCQALVIDRSLDGEDLLTSDRLYLLAAPPLPPSAMSATPRIGITKAADWPWRFVEAPHPCASRRRSPMRGGRAPRTEPE